MVLAVAISAISLTLGSRRAPGRRNLFKHASPSRRAMRSSYARNFRPEGTARPSREGAGNAGCPMHPQPRVRMVVVDAHEYSQQSHRNRPAFPHAMVLTASFALSSAIGFLATVVSENVSRQLDASIEASGPHDFSVRDRCPRQSAFRVHRISSRVRDDRDTPLMWNETAMDRPVIWVKTEWKYFLLWGSTAPTTPNLARRARLF